MAKSKAEEKRRGLSATSVDNSNGYDESAERYIVSRNPRIGAATVRQWSRTLPAGSSILDLGCGHGVPISQVLMEGGFTIFGVDASRKLMAAFHKRFPSAQGECCAVEDSEFFKRKFDGVVACGLMFLLPVDAQSALIRKVARALKADGKFLFTSPKETVTWRDSLTGRESISLGAERYRQILRREGLTPIGEQVDEGENHYYFATKS